MKKKLGICKSCARLKKLNKDDLCKDCEKEETK